MKKLFLQKFTLIFCLLVTFLLATQPIFACSWDYPIWQVRSKNADPLYRFVKDGKRGYINQEGKIVVEPILDFYGSNGGDQFFDGLLLTGIADGAYIDKTGKVVLDTKYDRNWDFSEGLAVAMKEDNGKWGYIDKTGKFIIKPQFDSYPSGYVYSFSDGLAMIKVRDKYGFINQAGKYVIEPKLLEARDFVEGLTAVIMEGPCAFIPQEPCSNVRVVGKKINEQKTYKSCKYSFIDKTGKLITSRKFERVKNFSEGLAAVQIGSKWGFINKQGKIVISPQFGDGSYFYEIGSFSDGLARFKQNKLWGYIDKQGNVIIPPKFEDADDFSDGLAPIGEWNEENSEYENYIFINKKGEQAFKGKFQLASHFFKGLAHVKLFQKNKDEDAEDWEGKYAYINTKGEFVFEYEARDVDEE